MNERISAAFRAIAEVGRPEVWIGLHEPEDVGGGNSGPLSGLVLAVKNNVGVAGFATTAGCPSYSETPAAQDSQAVGRLRADGAAVIGVTNLDQFATGLVGQRSPHGGVRDARRPSHISGGSSSGSAVAVALGLADLAIGTDTAGSGRIPAALQGIVGIKPTLGVVSTDGVVPACRSWDAVTVFARDLGTASLGMASMAGGPNTRTWPADIPLAAPPNARVAVPDQLPGLAPGYAEAFEAAVERLRAGGCTVETIPFETFLTAATLLYDGALVAERHAAVGEFVESGAPDLDPTVAAIISKAGRHTASAMVRDLARLEELRQTSMSTLAGFHALLVPTAPGHPSIAEVAADPVGVNSWMGTYTNFCNLFDLCAVAVPSGTAGEDQFGVTVLARPFHDAVALDLAERVQLLTDSVAAAGAAPARETVVPWPPVNTEQLLVVGAHLKGQPLARELEALGARWAGPARTAPAYTLSALDTVPPKPGLERVGPGGSSIVGELWELSTGALGAFLAGLPAPMNLGRVELDNGSWVAGFGCTVEAARAGKDITEHGGWLAYLGFTRSSGAPTRA
ncbi:allophanate hydrolase [Kineosporia rhizophila]|uniref:allophanate hydrolase n=1 Tax=Kineosporia rhizophila TaxID=84633 RepID=UPI001E57088A|nr:allophanate hydrolase [Kineosporia rhizophila]